MQISQETISVLEKYLDKRIPVEVRQEKGQVVLVEIKRKVISKSK